VRSFFRQILGYLRWLATRRLAWSGDLPWLDAGPQISSEETSRAHVPWASTSNGG